MSLIVSVSGVRGTVGGYEDDSLTPLHVLRFTRAFVALIKKQHEVKKVVVGHDSRPSWEIFYPVILSELQALGIDVVDLGLTTTPSLKIAVIKEAAQGGIMLSASHNPQQWNAMKFFNSAGEYLSPEEMKALQKQIANAELCYAPWDNAGKKIFKGNYLKEHIAEILNVPLIAREAIRKKRFKVVVDGINSSGAVFIPELLKELGINKIIVLNEEPHGRFAHEPEPLPKHLSALSEWIVKEKADLGIAVDPDVDRVAFYTEKGEPFEEEYSLVAAADYVLGEIRGPVVANLSTTAAVEWIAKKYDVPFYYSAVGEYYVVKKMKEVNAIIGGEGNGGIIYPYIHYGRDALMGTALVLSLLAERNISLQELKQTYPKLYRTKEKVVLQSQEQASDYLSHLQNSLSELQPKEVLTLDGIKLLWKDGWVHVRRSNTEPILRIYAEADDPVLLQQRLKQVIRLMGK